MEEAAGGRVLLALPAVSLSLPPELLRGRLRILRGPQDLELHWEPLEGPWEAPGDEDPPDPGFEPDWAVLSPPRARKEPGWAGGFRVSLRELRGLRRGPPGLRPPFLLLLPRGEGPGPPPLRLPRGGLRKILRVLGGRLRACPGDPRLLLLATPEDPPAPPPSPGLVTRWLQAPYAATLGGLSRLLGGPRAGAGPEPEPEPEPEPPFEELTCVRLGPRPSPPRGPPLAGAEWGRGLEPAALRERIFRGGVSPELRPRVWRLLLGLQRWGDPGGTPKTPGGTPKSPGGIPESEQARRDDYFRMKLQWRSLSPGQLRRNKTLRGYQEQLERDLARAPPSLPPSLLRDVLRTFCMFHFDLGYVRGMSEVLAPLAGVAPDEVEAFWAFCSVMGAVGENFGPGPEGLRRKLGELGALVRVVNPGLSPLLGLRSVRRCVSRWLQFRFLPHLGTEGTRRLCEVLWTGLPCPNFHLLVTCALLELLGDSGDTRGHGGDSDSDSDSDSDTDGDSDGDSDGDTVSPVLLEVGEVLSRAEGIFLQLASAAELPPALQELLGLGGAPLSPPDPEPVPPNPPREGQPAAGSTGSTGS